MQILADSGSTKTHWKILNTTDHTTQEVISEGINPYFLTEHQISQTIQANFSNCITPDLVESIFFYGAGCGSEQNKKMVSNAFKSIFEKAIVNVETDLLGAARAACGHNAGIAVILGTGSNSCEYDGEKIIKNMPSLGFILGDEGSGAYIGKVFIQSLLNKEIPLELEKAFYDFYNFSKDDIIRAVYKEAYPNRYLASFVKFLYTHKANEYVYGIFYNAFQSFFQKHILKYESVNSKPLYCVGSVAFYFQDILSEVCFKFNVTLKNVLEKPIDGIVSYHALQNIG